MTVGTNPQAVYSCLLQPWQQYQRVFIATALRFPGGVRDR